jgi:hypothetical protein
MIETATLKQVTDDACCCWHFAMFFASLYHWSNSEIYDENHATYL